MNLKKALDQRLNQPVVACCVPLGVQHATNSAFDATTDATIMQQTGANPIKTEVLNATRGATSTQQSCCVAPQKDSIFVALKKRVAPTVADLKPEQLAQQSCTWRLYFADPKHPLTHYVCVPPTTRAAVIAKFSDQGLTACNVDQSCKTCGWCIGQALVGSPAWCSSPKRRAELKPVYGVDHPAREAPCDFGATCEQYTTRCQE
jgi:hypothetical protein